MSRFFAHELKTCPAACFCTQVAEAMRIGQRQKQRKMQKMMTRLRVKQKKLEIPIPAEVAEQIEKQKYFLGS